MWCSAKLLHIQKLAIIVESIHQTSIFVPMISFKYSYKDSFNLYIYKYSNLFVFFGLTFHLWISQLGLFPRLVLECFCWLLVLSFLCVVVTFFGRFFVIGVEILSFVSPWLETRLKPINTHFDLETVAADWFPLYYAWISHCSKHRSSAVCSSE